MRFDAIVVPRGAEARAVLLGWPAAQPRLRTIPAGNAAGAELEARPLVGTSALVLGVCGALDPALQVGDVVVYERIVDGDSTIALDPELSALCAVACDRAPLPAAAVSSVLGDPSAKRTLREMTGAAVVDMEAAAVASALRRRGVRVAMVRVVSDDAARALPDLRRVYDARGALRPGAFALALLRSPGRSVHFVRNALRALSALRSTAGRLATSSAE